MKLSCRVMTFNYDSNWFMNAPQQRLSSISDTLLDSLRNKRDGSEVSPTHSSSFGHYKVTSDLARQRIDH
jgi:hypothetical protein